MFMFELMDKPGFGKGAGKPAFFSNYIADGELIDRGEPTRGEYVRNALTKE